MQDFPRKLYYTLIHVGELSCFSQIDPVIEFKSLFINQHTVDGQHQAKQLISLGKHPIVYAVSTLPVAGFGPH